jgi:hypothetical protein
MNLQVGVPLTSKKKCSVEGCPKEIYRKTMCRRHHNQIYKYGEIKGDPTKSYRDRNVFTEQDDFVVVETNDVWGNTTGHFTLDKEDWLYLKEYKWCIGAEGYPSTNTKKGAVRLHSFLLSINTNKKEVIDHKDRDKTNNRRGNLEVSSPLKNYLNSKLLRKDNKSGYIGVIWVKRANKWLSYVGTKGKRKYLGYFLDKQEAALVRDKVAISIWGKDAKLNFQERL